MFNLGFVLGLSGFVTLYETGTHKDAPLSTVVGYITAGIFNITQMTMFEEPAFSSDTASESSFTFRHFSFLQHVQLIDRFTD